VGVGRLRKLGLVFGLLIAALVFGLASRDRTLGLPEILGVAFTWGFIAWGLVWIASWFVEKRRKRSSPR
jgi:hypothetical protein